MDALRIVETTCTVPNMGTHWAKKIDRDHPVVLDFHIDESCLWMMKARFRVRIDAPFDLTVQIDSGEGFMDCTEIVSTFTLPWDAIMFDAWEYLNRPGQDVRVRFSSADPTDERQGTLDIDWTLTGEYSGLLTAAQ